MPACVCLSGSPLSVSAFVPACVRVCALVCVSPCACFLTPLLHREDPIRSIGRACCRGLASHSSEPDISLAISPANSNHGAPGWDVRPTRPCLGPSSHSSQASDGGTQAGNLVRIESGYPHPAPLSPLVHRRDLPCTPPRRSPCGHCMLGCNRHREDENERPCQA